MAEQMRPASPERAPDPADSYERAHPGREAGMGRLDNDKATPQQSPDRSAEATSNQQDGSRQINAQDAVNQRGGPAPVQPDHSMHDEEPDGWDLAPQDISDPRQKRHPRKEGKGGTP
jgi:hypothetical protein